MPKVHLNGIGLYYQEDGVGPRTFLLFNGFGATLELWGGFAEGLARLGRVIRFDARGLGRTDTPRQPVNLETLAADGLALLDYLGVPRAIVVGHAFGGRVAQVFARDYPDRLSALILCGTGGHFPPLPSRAAVGLNDRSVGREAWEEAFVADYCGRNFRREQPERAQTLLDEVWERWLPPGSSGRPGGAVQATPTSTYWGLARVPTLLLYGTEDRFGHEQNARDLQARLAGSRLVFFEAAGHLLIRECPEQLLQEITTFLGEQGL